MSRATIPNTLATQPGGQLLDSLLDANWTALLAPINDSSYGWVNCAFDSGTANAYAVTNATPMGAYRLGACQTFIPSNSCTGASTINVDGLGNVAINNAANQPLTFGGIEAGKLCTIVHDGTRFRMVGPCPAVIYNSAATGTATLNLAGYTSVVYRAQLTGNFTLSMLSLSIGIPVSLITSNSSGSAWQMSFTGNDPQGNTYSVAYKSGGQLGSVAFSNVSFANGTTDAFFGLTSNASASVLSPGLIMLHN
jgi:hypothetical protein